MSDFGPTRLFQTLDLNLLLQRPDADGNVENV
jgi:hypothetical protein